jgi:hypothetical protein
LAHVPHWAPLVRQAYAATVPLLTRTSSTADGVDYVDSATGLRKGTLSRARATLWDCNPS